VVARFDELGNTGGDLSILDTCVPLNRLITIEVGSAGGSGAGRSGALC
jgi:hypothetical protein